jgi:hypothetical protein
VKACKKKSTKAKYKRIFIQKDVRGGRAFISKYDCAVCVAQIKVKAGIKASVPKRAHDRRCCKNRRTKGVLSEESIRVETEALRNIAANNAPIVPLPIAAARFNPENNPDRLFGVFARAKPSLLKTGLADEGIAESNTAISMFPSRGDWRKHIANPSSIREAIDESLTSAFGPAADTSRLKFLKDARFPKRVGAAVDYMVNLFNHNKKSCTSKPLPATIGFRIAHENFRQFFKPGEAQFVFPQEVHDFQNMQRPPSPLYHFLEGESVIYLDWKLISPATPLLCPFCKNQGHVDCHLKHDRTNWSKNYSLFPLWTTSGVPTWCVIMRYTCETCKRGIDANDGRLLRSMPSYVRQAYPVEPKYAMGAFHLSKALTFYLENLMKTYASGSFFSKLMYKKMNAKYVTQIETYQSKNPTQDPISLSDYRNDFYPPSDVTVRALFKEGAKSNLTAYGYINKARSKREMQSVSVENGETVAFDWTFQTIKNWILPEAKAVFTGITGRSKQIISLAIVPSTKTSDVAHLLTQSRQKRTSFGPSVIYTDTCPNKMDFYKARCC